MIPLAFALAACASAPAPRLADHLSPERRASVKNPVAFEAQERYLCGPTTLKMAARGLLPEVPLDTYRALTFTERAHGTYKSEMISAARRLGLAPYRVPGLEEIFDLSEAGQPVIVFQNLGLSWWPMWHYALVVGYDAGANEVILHSGRDAYARMGFRLFVATWERGGKWAYVVERPESIPEMAGFDEALDNAQVFEKLGELAAAKRTYEALAERWPRRFEPRMGLAGVYYAEGRKRSALAHTRAALAREEGERPDLLFNLALLYFETGDAQKARLAKERLLGLVAPETAEVYRARLGF